MSDDDLLHLLRRTLFSVSVEEFVLFKNMPQEEVFNTLLKRNTIPPPPIQIDPDMKDPLVPIGQTWINAPFENDLIDNHRRIYFKAWWVGQLLHRDLSITSKMVLFWHNHFPIQSEVVKDARYFYKYTELLYRHATGNVKSLIKEGTRNVAMLVYLNGNTNRKNAPNENYSRELMELFTIGINGEKTYSEDDVKAAAKVLTGWKDNKVTISADFIPDEHDSSDKIFSPFFFNKVIKGKSGLSGADETDELIDMIFEKKECALFICKNLYRWFFSDKISSATEESVISNFADILYNSNYELLPVLKAMLQSTHFYSEKVKGTLIKSPIDYLIALHKQFPFSFPEDLTQKHLSWVYFYSFLAEIGMDIGDPPSVAGWPAFHQSPQFNLWWINSSTLSSRYGIIKSLTSAKGLQCNGINLSFNDSLFHEKLTEVFKYGQFKNLIERLFFSVPLSSYAKQEFERVLSSIEYTLITSDGPQKKIEPAESDKTESAHNIELFIQTITSFPEYQLV